MQNNDAAVENQNTVHQPKDSVIQPNASNPAERLPPETKGQIQSICSDPAIELKRRINHAEVMKMNTYSLQHGKYSKNYPLPDYLWDYLGYLDDMEATKEEVQSVLIKLIKDNLKRIVISQHIEFEKSQENIHLSKLIKETFTMLQALQNPLLSAITTLDSTQINISAITNLNDYERQSALTIIKDALARTRVEAGK